MQVPRGLTHAVEKRPARVPGTLWVQGFNRRGPFNAGLARNNGQSGMTGCKKMVDAD